MLLKPGKSPEDLRQLKGYRPVSLLSCLSKVLEKALAHALLQAFENAGILPNEQMNFRPGRSTEVACRLITDLIRTA